jgi:L-seryl-tRNA(Ser) seleniumtransferase
MVADDINQRLRALPSVDRVLEALAGAGGPAILADAARRAVDRARAHVQDGEQTPPFEAVVDDARSLLASHRRSLLRPVINATGVLIHTNLGRVPLGREQLDAVAAVASGYSNLEYDLPGGERGSRYTHAASLVTALTGAEDAVVVNNNAAAVLVVLASLCSGREVIISRGELIEIGGEFRIPEVLAASGASLVEVGTTNRTHLADYERAITPETAAILKVHPSNYRVVGFTASVEARDVAQLARSHEIPFIHDVGSGLVASPEDLPWTSSEPLVDGALADGADIVTFSGDKLLGGPQAGVIAGRRDLVGIIARHPLMRAVRVDKMTLAALEATLTAYLEGRHRNLPLWAMATAPQEELERRAQAVVGSLAEHLGATGVKVEAVATAATTGGGSLPGTDIGSWAVAVTHPEKSASEIHRVLRQGDPPVIGRIQDDVLLLDLRTVPPSEDDPLTERVVSCLRDN